MPKFNPVSKKQLEKCVRDLGNSHQKVAVLKFIHDKPFSLTSEICTGGGAINVPQVVKELRPTCQRYGIAIFNYLPQQRHTSRHGTKSQLHRWFIESIEQERTDQQLNTK